VNRDVPDKQALNESTRWTATVMVCERVVSFLPIAYFLSTEGATYYIATVCKVKSSSSKVIFIYEGYVPIFLCFTTSSLAFHV